MLSDGETKLSDLVFAMKDLYRLNIFFNKTSIMNIYICNDSPLWPGCSPLHVAVTLFANKFDWNREASEQRNLETLTNLCKRNPHMLYSQDVHRRTPLHLAFRINKKSILDILLSFTNGYCKWIDPVDEEGLTYAHIASAQNDVSLLERMLRMGADVNAAYEGTSSTFPNICRGSTALHFAVANGSVQAVNLLIKFGADVYAKDANDMTPIHLLLLNKNTSKKMADILLSLPNLKESIVDGIGLSHLHVASWCDKVEVVKRLLDNGSNVNSIITYQPSANKESSEFSFLDEYAGFSPLQIACHKGNIQTEDLLVKYNADYFIEITNGKPLLYSLIEEDENNLEWFSNTLKSRDDIDLRVKEETGITSLHIAYFNLDVNAIVKSLEEEANVNEQIPFNSPIWPGFTALHLFVRNRKESNIINEFLLKEILNAGADVIFQSADLKTAIHMAYEVYVEIKDDGYYYLVNMLLEAQRDFSVNPTSIDGISHFHIACALSNVKIVEKFLNNADIDVNQPIDYFHKNLPGRTALHLAASSELKLCGLAKQLGTVDLLLKHEADVHAEDSCGKTPLHACAILNYLDLFERLVRAGSDVNAIGISGSTPLDYYLESDEISIEGIKILLRFGCHFNSFDTVCDLGSVGRIVTLLPFEDVQNLFTTVIVNFPQEMETGELGRTTIHNIVSTEPCFISREVTAVQYVELFEQISKADCDVDAQDSLGRTALHMAVKFQNFRAISGLLLAGADVNIKDYNGNAITFPSPWDFALCRWCINSNEKRAYGACDHFEMFDTLAIHVRKLQMCRLDVNKENEDFTYEAFKKFKHTTALSENCFSDLYATKRANIGSHSLSLYDFLSEYGAVVDYPRMSEVKRNAVNEFFSLDKLSKIREEFPQLADILLLQYRKVRARSNLVELAKNAFAFFLGFQLPEICLDLILRLLKNSELKNFIASAILVEG